MDNIEARLENTENALYALITMIMDMQPPDVQDRINRVMQNCFEANESLGSKACSSDKFITSDQLEANNG